MDDAAKNLVRALPEDSRQDLFAFQLRKWLLRDLSHDESETPFAESRARALLRVSEATDDPTLNDFSRILEAIPLRRVALYDLLVQTKLADEGEIKALGAVAAATDVPATPTPPSWLSLAMAAFAWQRGYPVHQLDPETPPEQYTPAGQIVARTAHFVRQQVVRSATERERLSSQLAFAADAHAASLEALQQGASIAPLPPHFRPPVPVRYPEVARETLHVETGEESVRQVTRGEPLRITEEDLGRPEPTEEETAGETLPRDVERMAPIRISRDQVAPAPGQPPSPLPPSGVVMPASTSESRPGLTVALRQLFRSEELRATKLRVTVKSHPDGPGLFGLQVKVTCKGIKSYVAGTTDRQGDFVAELPVRSEEGLTYDIDVTWPQEYGGETERKSITLHADRTEFTLPFHRHLKADE